MERQTEMERKSYKGNRIAIFDNIIPIRIDFMLWAFDNGGSEYDVQVWQKVAEDPVEYLYNGSYRGFIELVLLGKLCKAEIEKKAKALEYRGLDQLDEADRNEIESICELDKVSRKS